MENEEKNINPLLNHKSTIKSKSVKIAGNDDFSSITDGFKKESKTTSQPKKEKTKITSARIETRVSDKLKLLHYFLPANEDVRLSFSQMVDDLVDSYVEDMLTDKQKDMFNQMLDN